jgi:hypothetical protein
MSQRQIRPIIVWGLGLAVLAGPAAVTFAGAPGAAGGGAVMRRAPNRMSAADAKAYRDRIRAAQRQLTAATRDVKTALNGDTQLVAARDAALKARLKYMYMQRDLRAQLAMDSEYKALQAEVYRAQDRLDASRRDGASLDDQFALARELLDARVRVTRMETERALADDALVQARYDMQDAQTALADLERDLQDRLQTDPRLVAARDNLRRARMGS